MQTLVYARTTTLMKTKTPPSAETPQASPQQEKLVLTALSRLGIPVLIFGVLFFALSMALTYLVSPDRFPVRVGDRVVRLSQLEAEERDLEQKKVKLLEAREELLRNSDATVLTQVEKLRAEGDDVGRILLKINAVRRTFITGDIDPIRIPLIEYDHDTHVLTIGGEVTDPASRSVSILSRFVDALREIPDLASTEKQTVSDPEEYAQKDLPDGGSVSPFTIRITLQHAESI